MNVLYAYKNCDTCRKAAKWLEARGIAHETRAIRETPPSRAELETALAANGNDLRKLFNTSGLDYRALNLKEKLPTLGKAEALNLLASNGNLVKRPFLVTPRTTLVGFNQAEWEEKLAP